MEKRRALITGASAGIGLELARIHAKNGHHMVLVARREERLLQLKEELEKAHGVEVAVIAADLSIPEAALDIHTAILRSGFEIEILINNAGFGAHGEFCRSNWAVQSGMIRLNIMALVHLTRLFSEEMVSRGEGRIMNIASTAAFQPGPFMSVYYASKHFVLAFSEGIATELRNTGISVTTLCPGPTQSEFFDRAGMKNTLLVSAMAIPDAKKVAEYGYRSMMSGKRIAVEGVLNRIGTVLVRLIPISLSSRIVEYVQRRRIR
ncbi:MAG: SDR family oxidoreductase [Balneolaceae bacterium]